MKVFDERNINEAAYLLQKGQLIAFPTETVFGLGANAFDETAVNKVFQVKGRPSDNPLIVHISNPSDVKKYATVIHPIEQALMDAFWPGPLTIVFSMKSHLFPENVNGGKNTIALRMPKNDLTLALIKAAGVPLVGPSANLSGKPSPTKFEHVVSDFEGKIAGVLKNNQTLTDIGLESTVVQVKNDCVYILRPGSITRQVIREKINVPVKMLSAEMQLKSDVQSPGVKYRHYSPSVPLYVLPANATSTDWETLVHKIDGKVSIFGFKEWYQLISNDPKIEEIYSYGSLYDKNASKYANQHLYDALRTLDRPGVSGLITQALRVDENQLAYMNRLTKASTIML